MRNFFREFDLQYWQMREALGYPIPDRIDRRFKRKLCGNGGNNPFKCGICEARRLYPALNISSDVERASQAMSPDDLADFHARILKALA